MRGLFHLPWQPLEIPSAFTPIGKLHQYSPSPVLGDRACGKQQDLATEPLRAATTRNKPEPTGMRITPQNHDTLFFDFSGLSLSLILGKLLSTQVNF